VLEEGLIAMYATVEIYICLLYNSVLITRKQMRKCKRKGTMNKYGCPGCKYATRETVIKRVAAASGQRI
jgi:hypothetical protein